MHEPFDAGQVPAGGAHLPGLLAKRQLVLDAFVLDLEILVKRQGEGVSARRASNDPPRRAAVVE